MTRDTEEKMLRDAVLRQRLAEIVELAKADPIFGISREEAMKRAAKKVAEKYKRLASEEGGGRR